MTLSLIGAKKLQSFFTHSSDFAQGLGTKQIRPGQSTIVVALDGSGDAVSIQDGIDLLPSTGGVVYIKEGIYKLTQTITITKSNVSLIGAGKSTQLIENSALFTDPTFFSASSLSNLFFTNIYFNLTSVGDIVGISFTTTTNSFISNCWFSGGSDFGISLVTNSNNNIIVQNNISSKGLYVSQSSSNIFIGNVATAAATIAIYLVNGASNNIISNNICSSSLDGIRIEAVSAVCDTNIISSNICQSNSSRGIYIYQNGSTCNKNILCGNLCTSNTTADITDTGTNTISLNNRDISILDNKQIFRMQNTSGGDLAIGDLVTLKAVAAGNQVTTTTTQGDDLVFGMVTETIVSNAYGNIQTLGKTTSLKVDGTTDIAIGDFIGTFTTAKIGMKAAVGDMAFAIALEAYTANDSNGVIDALLITPRKI